MKIENGHLTVKFDEIGVLSFGQKIPIAQACTGFEYFTLDILSTFASGLTNVLQNLGKSMKFQPECFLVFKQ